MSEMRALSIQQPWAWGICAGVKNTENRTWTTGHRGRIAIHASTSPKVVNQYHRESGCESMHRSKFTFGAIIGFADIVEVASYGQKHEKDPFAEGPYCWTLENGRFLKKPIPLPGKLNLFKLSEEIQHQLQNAVTFAVDLGTDSRSKSTAEAMSAVPDPVASYSELVDEYWRTGKHFEAMANAGDRLIELAPNESIGYMIRADIRLSFEDADDCSRLLQRAVELSPSDSFAWQLLSRAFLKENQFDSALAASERMICLAPEDHFSYETRARVYFRLKRYQQAIADLDTALSIDPESSYLLGVRAEAKAAIGDYSGAETDVAEARRRSPTDKMLIEIESDILGRK